MSVLKTPYLDEELPALERHLQDEPSFSKQYNSPFLENELFDENELDEMRESDAEWDDEEFEEAQGNDAYFEEDEYPLEEFEAESEDDIDYESYQNGHIDQEFLDDEDNSDSYIDDTDYEFMDEALGDEYDEGYDDYEVIDDSDYFNNETGDEIEEEGDADNMKDIFLDNHYEVEVEDDFHSEVPQINHNSSREGISSIAIQAVRQWDARRDRPHKWIGNIFGLVVHTTGGSLPGRAIKKGIYPTIQAMNWYTRNNKNKNFHGGCHYINGWQGMQGGDLLQIANEREKAWGVGMKEQRKSINNGRFERDLPEQLVRNWKNRWPSHNDSLALLPEGERGVNSCYVHVECTPVFYYLDKKPTISKEYPPMRLGLRFTRAQHDTIAYLACDIAIRNHWSLDEEWWRTSRLLGHEDISPITRKDKRGGWDPGYLRDKPYFDWDYVYNKIKEIKESGYKLPGQNPVRAHNNKWGDIVQKGKDILQSGKLIYIASAAISNGERDENKITNIVFYSKYPSKKNQKLGRNDPLIKDWVSIRSNVVRPLLSSLKKTRKQGSATASKKNRNVISPTKRKHLKVIKYQKHYMDSKPGALTKDREGMHSLPQVPKGRRDISGITFGAGIDLTTLVGAPKLRKRLAKKIAGNNKILLNWIIRVPKFRGEAARKWLRNHPMPGNGLNHEQLNELYRFGQEIFTIRAKRRLLGTAGGHNANPPLTLSQYNDLALNPTLAKSDFLLELLADLAWNSAHFAYKRQNTIARALTAENVRGDRYDKQIIRLGNLREFIERGNFGGIEGRWRRLGWIDAKITQLRKDQSIR